MADLRHKTFRITHTWEGRTLAAHERACMQVIWSEAGQTWVRWDAHWPKGPQPSFPPGQCWGLWEYPVIELFLVSAEGPYVELEFGPAGHWLALYLSDYRVRSRLLSPLDYRWWREGDRWKGSVSVVLPSHQWRRGNAFLIFRNTDQREYCAARSTPGIKPDFHRFEGYLAL
jgi:hypothetical protein